MKKIKLFISGFVVLGVMGIVAQFMHTSHSPLLRPVRPSSTSIQTTPDHTASPTPSSRATSTASKSTSPSASVVTASVAPQPVYRKSVDNKSFTVYTPGKAPETFPLRQYHTLSVNDPNGSQWWTRNTGLETAWNAGAGSRQTIVAVIDTGFALKHEEFAGRWFVNSGEIGPTTQEAPSQLNCTDRGLPLDKSCNLIDNDGNGLINDTTGWDFANFDNNVQAGEVNPNGTSTTHGTEVTGVLGATGNNGKGIAGVNWSTKILPLQAIDDDGYGDTLTVSRAIRYAADMHADVISISLGSSSEDPYLRQTIQYALSKGSLVVAASGNDGCNCMVYPAAYPEVIGVGSESPSGTPSSFSSYGASLDILAPGENITSTTWSSSNPTSAYVSGIAGTSFATPYVSGLLALARSYQPNASWGELTNALLAQARHDGLSPASPFSSTLGFGYAQADTLLSRVKTATSPSMRYYLGPFSATQPLSTADVYQCGSGDFPTARVYELTKGSSVRYTISELEQSQASTDGWTVTPLWYSCVGLPTDTPTTIRDINLFSEVRNSPAAKQTP